MTTQYDRNALPVSPHAPLVGPRCRRCRKHQGQSTHVPNVEQGHTYLPMGAIEDELADHISHSNLDGMAQVVIKRLTIEADTATQRINDLEDALVQLRRDAGV